MAGSRLGTAANNHGRWPFSTERKFNEGYREDTQPDCRSRLLPTGRRPGEAPGQVHLPGYGCGRSGCSLEPLGHGGSWAGMPLSKRMTRVPQDSPRPTGRDQASCAARAKVESGHLGTTMRRPGPATCQPRRTPRTWDAIGGSSWQFLHTTQPPFRRREAAPTNKESLTVNLWHCSVPDSYWQVWRTLAAQLNKPPWARKSRNQPRRWATTTSGSMVVA